MILTPANDASGVSDELRDSVDRLRDRLAQIEQRLADRLAIEERSISEEYIKERLNIALEFLLPCGSYGEDDLSISDLHGNPAIRIAAFVANSLEPDVRHSKNGDDQLVFVDGIKLGNGPKAIPSTLVGFKVGEDVFGQAGTGFLYRSYFAAGGCKLFSPLVKGEIHSGKFPTYDSGHRMIKSGTKIMNDISDQKRETEGQILRSFYSKSIAPCVTIRLYDNAAQIICSESLHKSAQLIDMSIGPLNL